MTNEKRSLIETSFQIFVIIVSASLLPQIMDLFPEFFCPM